MKVQTLFSIAAGIGVLVSYSSAVQGQVVAGFDQRYIGANYDPATGILPDEVSASQNAFEVGGSGTGGFSFTTTPSGAQAVQNIDVLVDNGAVDDDGNPVLDNEGDEGNRLEFVRDNTLGGTSGLTIQAVFSGNSSPSGDGGSGVFGLQETSGFSGLFLGGRPGVDANGDPTEAPNLEVRGGNVDDQGNTEGAFLNDGSFPNLAAVDQFVIYTLVVDPTASPVLTATIVDPVTGDVLASTSLGDPGTSIDGIGNIGGLFAGEVGFPGGAFDIQDNFNGAIADVVVYNSVLSAAELAQNDAYFNETYFVASDFILGDVDMNGIVNFFDISPFINILSAQGFQLEADIDGDGMVTFFDIQPFIDILAGG